jgi:hypothetical protein
MIFGRYAKAASIVVSTLAFVSGANAVVNAEPACDKAGVAPTLKTAHDGLKALTDALLNTTRSEADIKKFNTDSKPIVATLKDFDATNENVSCLEDVSLITNAAAGTAINFCSDTSGTTPQGCSETALSTIGINNDTGTALSALRAKLPTIKATDIVDPTGVLTEQEVIAALTEQDKAKEEFNASAEELGTVLGAELDPEGKPSEQQQAIKDYLAALGGSINELKKITDKTPLSGVDRDEIEKLIKEKGLTGAINELLGQKNKAQADFKLASKKLKLDFEAAKKDAESKKRPKSTVYREAVDKAKAEKKEALKAVKDLPKEERREARKAIKEKYKDAIALAKENKKKDVDPSVDDLIADAKVKFTESVNEETTKLADSLRDIFVRVGSINSYVASKNTGTTTTTNQ